MEMPPTWPGMWSGWITWPGGDSWPAGQYFVAETPEGKRWYKQTAVGSGWELHFKKRCGDPNHPGWCLVEHERMLICSARRSLDNK